MVRSYITDYFEMQILKLINIYTCPGLAKISHVTKTFPDIRHHHKKKHSAHKPQPHTPKRAATKEVEILA